MMINKSLGNDHPLFIIIKIKWRSKRSFGLNSSLFHVVKRREDFRPRGFWSWIITKREQIVWRGSLHDDVDQPDDEAYYYYDCERKEKIFVSLVLLFSYQKVVNLIPFCEVKRGEENSKNVESTDWFIEFLFPFHLADDGDVCCFFSIQHHHHQHRFNMIKFTRFSHLIGYSSE